MMMMVLDIFAQFGFRWQRLALGYATVTRFLCTLCYFGGVLVPVVGSRHDVCIWELLLGKLQ